MQLPSREIRVAVDIGGTFTDLEIFDSATQAVHQHKSPSTPADPSIGLLRGLRDAAARFGFAVEEVRLLLHGTTIATNAVLERKLPRGAVLTTAGFEDLLQIGRHGRRDIYALTADPPPPLVPRNLCLGVTERLRADGSVAIPLDEASLRVAASRLREAGVQAVAVCLLHAYANPAHERRVGALLAELLPGVAVSLSADISPELREYERLSTTVLNALLVPIVAGYMRRLEASAAAAALTARLYLVQSNGGVSGTAKAGREPARLLLSGPSGGAAAARRLSATLGLPNLVAIDMGGTSFDVSVVHGGQIAMVTEGEVDGLPVRLPMVEMRTIGAGGGSIAWVDAGGRLRIGPHSAGADPGPACYGRGGTALTVTDANLLLGRLDAANFLGGAMRLDLAAAAAAAARLAAPLGLGAEAAAEGVIAITNATLAGAIRLSLFEKGLDPADFALLSFGGAGGVHACEVAAELGIGRVVFPPHASTLSAWGILWSDITHDLSATQIMALADAGPALAEAAARLAAEAAALLDEDGVAPAQRRLEWSADCRYAGQAFELSVPLAAADFSAIGLATVAEGFHALHRQRFAHDDRGVPVEIVSLRLTARGLLPRPEGEAVEPAAAPAAAGSRALLIEGTMRPAAILSRGAVPAAPALPGPAVIEEAYTSTYIPPGWAVAAHPSGALIAEPIR
ncbi:hydantoinase/oxoprolinase family protein [Falsiroseomonas selenitidurans]|uniref:Hydantoinase/oxoprolinase family protein n=1 Tax=Falsiroseomonas selenitidurans TaxID=2716335 RepID=A0ABX1EE16_9PROT|nr:hydantoinase/oxoprolinase family protein [Falsiroseomonas selenitidurans]NKC34137.1 hydantoinase/oxoprolinase family protein [Falsiroseomonas selenitidurans]